MIVRGTTIRNSNVEPLMVFVEPWGEQHQVAPQDSIRVVFYCARDGEPEVSVEKHSISIYGWAGSDFLVVKNNVCVDQPDLRTVIRWVWRSEAVRPLMTDDDENTFKLQYAQDELDTSPYWDENGRRAALTAVSMLAPLLGTMRPQLTWQFCQHVLHRRGVFLQDDEPRMQKFIKSLTNEFEDIYGVLDGWHQVPSGKARHVRI